MTAVGLLVLVADVLGGSISGIIRNAVGKNGLADEGLYGTDVVLQTRGRVVGSAGAAVV